jgi:hypothetical protein
MVKPFCNHPDDGVRLSTPQWFFFLPGQRASDMPPWFFQVERQINTCLLCESVED